MPAVTVFFGTRTFYVRAHPYIKCTGVYTGPGVAVVSSCRASPVKVLSGV